MNQSKISVRYAKAFVEAAKEQNVLDAVRADVKFLLELIKEVPEMDALLESPVLSTSDKISGIKSTLSSSLQPLSLNFLIMVIENRREMHMKLMLLDFDKMYKESQGVKSAELTTAVPIDDILKQQIAGIIQQKFNSKIELSSKVDPDILGGLIMRVEDRQYDMSVATRLNDIKQKFLNS